MYLLLHFSVFSCSAIGSDLAQTLNFQSSHAVEISDESHQKMEASSARPHSDASGWHWSSGSELDSHARQLNGCFHLFAADAEDLVVELSFREHFVVASSTPVYQQQLARLPSVFVGGRSALLKVVSVMAVAAAEMYLETRTEPPPWRSRSALLSKWLPARAFDSPVLGITSWRTAASTVAGTMDSCNVSDSYDSSSAASSYASLGSSVMSSGYQAELEMHTGAQEKRASSGAQLKQQGSVSASQVIYNAAAPVLRIVQPRVVYGFAI